MDYLCELPNDSARRKALDDLPPTLNATYERILGRVSQNNKAVETLVSRTLRWIVHRSLDAGPCWTTAALCEAVSVNIGDEKRDATAICDETDILRWCSSLVRKSANDSSLELAHFTVKEFLLNLGNEESTEFAAYRVGPGRNEIDLAKVCLTYLNFEDFDQRRRGNEQVSECRFEEYPLRKYAVHCGLDHSREYLDDCELLSLVKQFMRPSKSNNLLSWAEDFAHTYGGQRYNLDDAFSGASTLHFAAMLFLPEVCEWLLKSGCDVNRTCALGTQLHCALIGPSIIAESSIHLFNTVKWGTTRRSRTVELLLEGGADPNCYFHEKTSPLSLALASGDAISSLRLLERGGTLDDQCIYQLEKMVDVLSGSHKEAEDMEELRAVLNYAITKNMRPEHRGDLLELALRTGVDVQRNSLEVGDAPGKKADYEQYLLTAVEYGQLEIVKQLLKEQVVDLNASQARSKLTALHLATKNDHLEVIQLFLDHGAQPNKFDSQGRTAIHHSVEKESLKCLEVFLKHGTSNISTEIEGLTTWHLAAMRGNTDALETLIKYSKPLPKLFDLRAGDGRSPLLCAASAGSSQNVGLLLDHGCEVSETANDGSTAMHQASRLGSLETIQLLIDRGADIHAVTEDDSNMLHHAIMEINNMSSAVVDLLLERGVDPRRRRRDGAMPIHLLLSAGTDDAHTTEGEQTMRKLASHTHNATFEGLLPLNQICLMQSSAKSTWLLSIFKLLLEQGADLGTQEPMGKTALRALVDTWKASYARQARSKWRKSRVYKDTVTQMIHTALEYVPSSGPLHRICADPAVCILALKMFDEKLVYKILEHSPDVDDDANDETSIIKTACKRGVSLTLLRELLSRSRASLDSELGGDLVCLACLATSFEFVQELLNSGLSPNGRSPSGESSLMGAAKRGNVDVVNLLISRGADLGTIDNRGCNVVHWALASEKIDVIRILKDTEVDWNSKIRLFTVGSERIIGGTALHMAATISDSQVLEFLLKEDLFSDINSVADGFLDTPLSLAAWSGLPRNVSILLAKGADASIMTNGSESPIHTAVRFGELDIVKEFIHHGCDISLTDNYGLSCEMIAWKFGHIDIAEMLRKLTEEKGILIHTLFSIGENFARTDMEN